MKEVIHEIFQYLDTYLGRLGNIYLIGGSTRDFLLNRKFDDFDFASDIFPNDIASHIASDTRFIKYGTINVKYKSYKITLTSFRQDIAYLDYRHPEVRFIKDLKLDSCRRDFKMNAIYMDKNFNVIDPQLGLEDLSKKRISMIGDIPLRIKEDPLRILRCLRFEKELNFSIEDKLKTYIFENIALLKNVRIEKINLELNKIKNENDKLDILNLLISKNILKGE